MNLSFYVELERFEERAISHWNALKDAMRRLNRSVLQWQLIKSELLRVAEFSTLAENRSEAYERLRDVLVSYDLEHVI